MSSEEFHLKEIYTQWQEKIQQSKISEDYRVRLHRSFSWAFQMEKHQEEDRIDEAFLSSWISLNKIEIWCRVNVTEFDLKTQNMNIITSADSSGRRWKYSTSHAESVEN